MFQIIGDFFNLFLYKPLFNLLVLFYNIIPGNDFGVAIIFLTLLIKFILYPLSLKSFKSQKVLQDLQPKIKNLQEKYKNDKESLARATLDLYRNEKINPFSGLFLAFMQLPILIALYSVFSQGLKAEQLSNLYNFIKNPIIINPIFLGLIDLSKPNIILAVLAGILQFFQTKMASSNVDKKNEKIPDVAKIMQTQMLYFFPVITIIILLNLPSALGLYWVVGSGFSILQQYYIIKKNK